MTRADWFLFSFTFVVGITAGIFLYVTSFKPVYQPEGGISESEEKALDFSVIGSSYGGMLEGYVHPSFRVTEDGVYSYFEGGVDAAQLEQEEGTLPPALLEDLVDAVEDADLAALAAPAAKEQCNTFVDGNDYTYRIMEDGIQYELDTCDTALSYNDELTLVLNDVWAYMEAPDAYEGTTSERASSVQEYLSSFLRGYFAPEEKESGE